MKNASLTYAWRYIKQQIISQKYFCEVHSPRPPGGPATSKTHLPSTHSKTEQEIYRSGQPNYPQNKPHMINI